MTKLSKFTIAIFSVLLTFSYCTPKNISSTENVANKTYTAAQLEEGHTIWQANCGKCHQLYPPESHNWEQWQRILNRMIPKAKLDAQQGELVAAYIHNNLTEE